MLVYVINMHGEPLMPLPDGQEGFIKGKRTSGYFAVSTLDGTVIDPSISYKKLRLLEKQVSLLYGKEGGRFLFGLKSGVSTALFL